MKLWIILAAAGLGLAAWMLASGGPARPGPEPALDVSGAWELEVDGRRHELVLGDTDGVLVGLVDGQHQVRGSRNGRKVEWVCGDRHYSGQAADIFMQGYLGGTQWTARRADPGKL